MFDGNVHQICVNCNNDFAAILSMQKTLPKLVHKTLCSLLEVFAKVEDVGRLQVGDVL